MQATRTAPTAGWYSPFPEPSNRQVPEAVHPADLLPTPTTGGEGRFFQRTLALTRQTSELGLARLFLRGPRILVLDEASSALDLETEARVRRNLWQAFPDRTAFVISHRPVGLEEFDRILFLDEGRLTPVGPSELKALLMPDRPFDEAWQSPWTKGGDHVSDSAH